MVVASVQNRSKLRHFSPRIRVNVRIGEFNEFKKVLLFQKVKIFDLLV